MPNKLDRLPIASTEGHYLYLTYTRLQNPYSTLRRNLNKHHPIDVFKIFYLLKLNLAKPVYSYEDEFSELSAPTVDRVGAVYVETFQVSSARSEKPVSQSLSFYAANSCGYLEACQGNLDNNLGNYGVPCTWNKHLSSNDLSKSMPAVAEEGTTYVGDPITAVLYAVNHEKDAEDADPRVPLSPYGITVRPAIDNKNGLIYIVDRHGGLFAIAVTTL